MLNNLLAKQWGIWFIYHGESYEGNVHLITTLKSPSDLAYFWVHSPIASLSNYFLAEGNKQRGYHYSHIVTRLTAPLKRLTQLNISHQESSQNGRILKIKRAVALFFRSQRTNPTRRNYMNGLPSF